MSHETAVEIIFMAMQRIERATFSIYVHFYVSLKTSPMFKSFFFDPNPALLVTMGRKIWVQMRTNCIVVRCTGTPFPLIDRATILQ